MAVRWSAASFVAAITSARIGTSVFDRLWSEADMNSSFAEQTGCAACFIRWIFSRSSAGESRERAASHTLTIPRRRVASTHKTTCGAMERQSGFRSPSLFSLWWRFRFRWFAVNLVGRGLARHENKAFRVTKIEASFSRVEMYNSTAFINSGSYPRIVSL